MSPDERRLRLLLLRTRRFLSHDKGCVIELPWECSCGLYELLSSIEAERVGYERPERKAG